MDTHQSHTMLHIPYTSDGQMSCAVCKKCTCHNPELLVASCPMATQATIPIYFPTGPGGEGEMRLGEVRLVGDIAVIKLVEGEMFSSLLLSGAAYIGMAVALSPATPGIKKE